MKIKLQHSWRLGGPQTWDLRDLIEHVIAEESRDGQLETVSTRIDAIAEILGRLVNILAENKAITPDDALIISGARSMEIAE